MKFSYKAYSNKTILQSYAIIAGILLLAYLLEWIKGSRTLGYTLCFLAICLIPVAFTFAAYRRNKESVGVSVITGIGYSLMYVFAVFTTNSVTPFTYAFPMFAVFTIFPNILYSGLFCGVAFLANVVYVIYHQATVGYQASEIPDLEIRLISLLITGIFVVRVTMANRKNNTEKIREINEKHEAAGAMMGKVLEASDSLIGNVGQVNSRMESLSAAMGKINVAMGEVSSGNAEVAEAIQMQIEQTEEIQGHISAVKDAAEDIESHMISTGSRVKEGSRQMEALVEQVGRSREANTRVLEQMKELTEYARQMNTITETITNIADSTMMLSLNASIEAARAGDAGKGFGVVAGEISALASQTMTATVNITGLIEHIYQELDLVSQAVNEVMETNEANAESTRRVQESFSGIIRGTGEVEKRTRGLSEVVRNLEDANGSIIEKIQTISAITEEVSAHASETHESCEANSRIVEDTRQIVGEMNANAEELRELKA